MILRNSFSLLLIALVSLPAAFGREKAQGREGNGGDPVALEFQQAALDAVREIESRPALFPEVDPRALKDILNGAKILVSDTPLPLQSSYITQTPAAINYRNPDLIVIYRAGWSANQSRKIRQALALHELLSLRGLEETGVYRICQAFLANVDEAASAEKVIQDYLDVTEDRPRETLILPGVTEKQMEEIIDQNKLCSKTGSQLKIIGNRSLEGSERFTLAAYTLQRCVKKNPSATCTHYYTMFNNLMTEQYSQAARKAVEPVYNVCAKIEMQKALDNFRRCFGNICAPKNPKKK